MTEPLLPKAYIQRRFHSLAGIWLVLFLLEHLLTNSLAGLYIGDWGEGFVRMVNHIHDLPYLEAIEIALLGLPLLLHGYLGLKYLFTSKFSVYKTSKAGPNLSGYARNHAFTWQRLTSWVLLFGIILHVLQMRFLNYPAQVNAGINQQYYMVRLDMDAGLYALGPRLGVQYFNPMQIAAEKEKLMRAEHSADASIVYNPDTAAQVDQMVLYQVMGEFMAKLDHKPLKPTQVVAVTQSFGTAALLTVRDTFKSPLMISLYTLFVIAACFHAFNGLWTAMIAWGITLSARSQQVMRWIAVGMTVLLALLGLAAIWLTYLVNLR